MEINICLGKADGRKNVDFPEIAKIEVESVEDYLQKRELIKLVREKSNNQKAMIFKTIFDPKNNNLFVYTY